MQGGSCRRRPFSLQPALRRHLHEGGGAIPKTRPRLLSGSRVEANLLRAWECPGGAVQHEQHREPQDAAEGGVCSLWTHSHRIGFTLNLDLLSFFASIGIMSRPASSTNANPGSRLAIVCHPVSNSEFLCPHSGHKTKK